MSHRLRAPCSAALLAASLAIAAWTGGCARAGGLGQASAPMARVEAARATEPDAGYAPAIAAPIPALVAAPSSDAPLRLGLGSSAIDLPAGRSIVEVATAPDRLVSLALFGDVEALLGFEVLGAASSTPLGEDGLLPRVVSLHTGPDADALVCVVDTRSPLTLARQLIDPSQVEAPAYRALKADPSLARPLVGFPSPASPLDGYVFAVPERYLFTRVDVALTLRTALRQVHTRFRGDAIAISDASQWNGLRPATDLGQPHHISHEGGRDVDLALPANDGEGSTIRRHCTGVLIEEDRLVCEPGTSRGVDALRLAYMLGLIVDSTPEGAVIKIFTDDAYIRDIRGALDTLQRRRWIKDRGYAALSEDEILRPSAWHTDHVHVRFGGEPGRAPW